MVKQATDAERKIRHIRAIRRAALILTVLVTLWWPVEFITYPGRTGFDAVDLGFLAIVITAVWLVSRAWHARCPQCGNPFFVNRGLPLWFQLSLQCPYCSFNLHEFPQSLDEQCPPPRSNELGPLAAFSFPGQGPVSDSCAAEPCVTSAAATGHSWTWELGKTPAEDNWIDIPGLLVFRQRQSQFTANLRDVCRLCRRPLGNPIVLRLKCTQLSRREIDRLSLEGWLKHDFAFFGQSKICESCAKAKGFIQMGAAFIGWK
jgi:hypothetical protein